MSILDNNFTEEADYKAENIWLKDQLKQMQREHEIEVDFLRGEMDCLRRIVEEDLNIHEESDIFSKDYSDLNSK